MHSKNYPPTAKQKQFWGYLADRGCLDCGSPAQIHHILGASAKHNKVHIGQWACVPVCPSHHREWESRPKREQLNDFVKRVLELYWLQYGEVPLSTGELLAVMTWQR